MFGYHKCERDPDVVLRNPCKPNPCQNGGNCTITNTTGHVGGPLSRSGLTPLFNCSCPSDWLGQTCEETRYCSMDSKSNQFRSRGLRIDNFPRATTSVAVPFLKLRESTKESVCLPGFMFDGDEEFKLACCPIPGPNGTRNRDRALVQLGESVPNCATYERLLLSDGLIRYDDDFFGCNERPQRFVAYVLIAVVVMLSVTAVIAVIIYKLHVGALDPRRLLARKTRVAAEETSSNELSGPQTTQERKAEVAPDKMQHPVGKVGRSTITTLSEIS